MSARVVTPWVVLLALAGCSQDSEPLGTGQGSPNVPAEMLGARPAPSAVAPEERAKKVDERLKEAQAAAEKKEYVKAIDALRAAILIEPKDRRVILELARAYQAKSQAALDSNLLEAYQAGVAASEYMRTLRDYFPDQTDDEKKLAAEVYFGEATQQAMSLRVEETTAALNDAVGEGFADFDRVRDNPRWKKMLEVPQFKKTWDDMDKRFPSKKK